MIGFLGTILLIAGWTVGWYTAGTRMAEHHGTLKIHPVEYYEEGTQRSLNLGVAGIFLLLLQALLGLRQPRTA